MGPDTDTQSFYPVPKATPARRDLYARMKARHAAPLWEAMGRLIPPSPEP